MKESNVTEQSSKKSDSKQIAEKSSSSSQTLQTVGSLVNPLSIIVLDSKIEPVLRHKQYSFERKLPKNPGSFGVTYIGKKVTMPVAIRVLDLERLSPKFFDDKFIPRHLSTLVEYRRNCPDRNVVRLYDVIRSQNRLYLFMEYHQTNLAEYMEKSNGPIEDLQKIRQWTEQLLKGLKFLHLQLKISHRHIKLQNALIDRNGIIRLTDFGLAKEFCNQPELTTTVICATEPYQCPQHLRFQQHNPYCADIWALAIVFYYILKNRFPFDIAIPRRTVLLQQTELYPKFLLETFSGNVKNLPPPLVNDLVVLMLNPDETKRPTPEIALKHQWFQQ